MATKKKSATIFPKVECKVCKKMFDTRGIGGHMLTHGKGGKVKKAATSGLVDPYRQGYRDGFRDAREN